MLEVLDLHDTGVCQCCLRLLTLALPSTALVFCPISPSSSLCLLQRLKVHFPLLLMEHLGITLPLSLYKLTPLTLVPLMPSSIVLPMATVSLAPISVVSRQTS
jgi:hypothetical protein